MWLSTTTITPRVRGQRGQVAVVDRGVGVLLRVEDPDEQVGELDEAVDLEVVRRPRWSRGRAGRAARRPRGRGRPGRSRGASPASSGAARGCRATPAGSAAPALPHTQAVAHEVVGRRTPVEDSSRPVRALKVEDLPEPVAPAIATTVCSAESRSRPAARLATCSTSSSSASSSRPRPAATADSRPSMRAPTSVPRVTSLRAPSSRLVTELLLGRRPSWSPGSAGRPRVEQPHAAGRLRRA